jgi:hypothetical protein
MPELRSNIEDVVCSTDLLGKIHNHGESVSKIYMKSIRYVALNVVEE